MLDANGDFMNTCAPTRQDPSTGGFSTPDVTIVHESLQELCDWSPCEFISSDHITITITLNLQAEQPKGHKQLVWDCKKGNHSAFIIEVEGQKPLDSESRKMKIDEMYARISAILLKAA